MKKLCMVGEVEVLFFLVFEVLFFLVFEIFECSIEIIRYSREIIMSPALRDH